MIGSTDLGAGWKSGKDGMIRFLLNPGKGFRSFCRQTTTGCAASSPALPGEGQSPGTNEPGSSILHLPRIGTIATMASRLDTFSRVLPAIHRQVDHLFVYLDGYSKPPSFLDRFQRLTVLHAEDFGNLHSSSRFLCLTQIEEPAVIISVDDDIAYPKDYVDRLVEALAEWNGQAVVGVHGRIFVPPYASYVRDAECLHFSNRLKRQRHVHELGSGTCAFVSDRLDVDPRDWPSTTMDDICMAIEAQQRSLPRIAIPRSRGWLKARAQDQPDSLWRRTRENDAQQGELMKNLLRSYLYL